MPSHPGLTIDGRVYDTACERSCSDFEYTEIDNARLIPTPAGPLHDTEESDVQTVLWHAVADTLEAADASAEKNSDPATVNIWKKAGAILAIETEDTVGASKEYVGMDVFHCQ